jgi:hypothetical protein
VIHRRDCEPPSGENRWAIPSEKPPDIHLIQPVLIGNKCLLLQYHHHHNTPVCWCVGCLFSRTPGLLQRAPTGRTPPVTVFRIRCSGAMVSRAVLSRAVSAAPWGCVVLASVLLHAPRSAAFGTGASCSAPVGLPGGMLAPARKIARTGLTMATPAEFEGVYNFNHVITMSSACVTWCWQLLVLHPRSLVPIFRSQEAPLTYTYAPAGDSLRYRPSRISESGTS